MNRESMPFDVFLELATAGKGAVSQRAFADSLAASGAALEWLRKAATDKSIELLSIPTRRDDVEQARAAAAKLSENTSDIAVLGIGGSSLGGQALLALRTPRSSSPRIRF